MFEIDNDVIERLRTDDIYFINLLKRDYTYYKFASPRQKKNRKLTIEAAKANGYILAEVNEKFKADKEIVLAAAKSKGRSIWVADEKLRDDREIVLAAVQNDGVAFKMVSDRLKNDKLINLLALKSDIKALLYMNDTMKSDEDIALVAVLKSPTSLQYFNDNIKDNMKIVLAAVTQDGYCLQFATPRLKCAPEVVLAAVQNEPLSLIYADKKLRKEKEIISEAMKFNPFSLECAILDVNDPTDFQFVKNTLKKKGSLLEYLDNDFKKNEEIILEAVKNDGLSIMYTEYQTKEVALAAVTQNPYSLLHVDLLIVDKDIVNAAIKQNSKVLNFIKNQDFVYYNYINKLLREGQNHEGQNPWDQKLTNEKKGLARD